ncbi:methyltransferase [Diaporthe helianthi]|uniref:Methyltransferase n=1 Tax=Diaporthe helianthi TaxID=158607 RepID=A0A2P5HZJ1_DIAHE|nr:methyltransferase [Diaporthe helianthi]
MTSSGNDRFNAEAAAWDSNPDVRAASASALQALLAAQPPLLKAQYRGDGTSPEGGGLDVLEIGCGTGLLTVLVAPHVRSILAIDAAGGMIDALRLKLQGAGPDLRIDDGGDDARADAARRVIQPLNILLEDPEDPRLPPGAPDGKRQKFDLVISHLTLHHIPDLKSLLSTMYGCLRPGGQIALTDFEDFGPEARKFHPEAKMFGVERHGINAGWFAGLMKEAGFEDVNVSVAWTMEKEVERYPGEWGHEKPQGAGLAKMDFPFLLCRGTRRN